MAMVKVTEVKGYPCVFTLKDGTTLRVRPYASKEIKDSLISDEVNRAVASGYVRLSTVKNSKTETKTGGGK